MKADWVQHGDFEALVVPLSFEHDGPEDATGPDDRVREMEGRVDALARRLAAKVKKPAVVDLGAANMRSALKYREAAELGSVSVSTIEREVKCGNLVAVPLTGSSRSKRIPRVEFDLWMSRRTPAIRQPDPTPPVAPSRRERRSRADDVRQIREFLARK